VLWCLCFCDFVCVFLWLVPESLARPNNVEAGCAGAGLDLEGYRDNSFWIPCGFPNGSPMDSLWISYGL
jgi:hypothetical protein